MLRVIEEAQTGFEPVNNGFAIRHDGATSDSSSDAKSHHNKDLRDEATNLVDLGRRMVEKNFAHDWPRLASIRDWLDACPVDLPPHIKATIVAMIDTQRDDIFWDSR